MVDNKTGVKIDESEMFFVDFQKIGYQYKSFIIAYHDYKKVTQKNNYHRPLRAVNKKK